MADSVSIQGGKSAAEVAYALLLDIASTEEKHSGHYFTNCDRAYILDTYAECLKAARGLRTRASKTD
jgi:hypothetical protein